MAILKVLHYPDPRLRLEAETVTTVDGEMRTLIDNMFETMYEAPGVGLAAPQVDVQQRIIVIDVMEDRSQPLCFINPEILTREGAQKMEEGCLSIPGVYEIVSRAEMVKVRALNRQGEQFEMEAEGLLATCIQHEMDHLEGKLFIDYLSELKRGRVRKKMEKVRRQAL
ncbi:MAG TPA: peptide deformylase [Gammaproteobacteria bacterium]|nr:peptide deformylase [Gammaproteobacteria bacterium]